MGLVDKKPFVFLTELSCEVALGRVEQICSKLLGVHKRELHLDISQHTSPQRLLLEVLLLLKNTTVARW